MKRLLLALALAGSLSAQWTVWDPTNYGLNLSNLEQAVADSQRALQYYQMVRQAQAFIHNPAAFAAAGIAITGMAITDSTREGWTSNQKAAQLKAKLQLGQVIAGEAGSMENISQANASTLQQNLSSILESSEQLAKLNKQIKHEERSRYYMDRNQYQDQGAVIAAWSLK